MGNTPKYAGGLTREQFLFYENRIVAKLILEDKSYEEILKQVIDEDLFQYPSKVSYRTITKACYKRLTFTEDRRIVDLVANANSKTAKYTLLYAMMCQNLLVKDFMVDVIGEKYKSRVFVFDKTDVNHFFVQLATRVEDVAGWSDATVGKIKSVLVKCLAETGYLTSIKSTELNPITVDDELLDLIRDRGDFECLPAFNEI